MLKNVFFRPKNNERLVNETVGYYYNNKRVVHFSMFVSFANVTTSICTCNNIVCTRALRLANDKIDRGKRF